MSIDLTSYGAPVQQPRHPAPLAMASEGQTLTLQLRVAASARSADPMSGLLAVRDLIAVVPGNSLHLQVEPSSSEAMTITF